MEAIALLSAKAPGRRQQPTALIFLFFSRSIILALHLSFFILHSSQLAASWVGQGALASVGGGVAGEDNLALVVDHQSLSGHDLVH